LFKNKQYFENINHIMTKLTSENNFSGQLDNCYIIVDGVFVVLIVDNAGP